MRPDGMASTDLLRAACVRAFMGAPRLLLLDSPVFEQASDLVPALLNELMETRDRQAASIWLTRSDAMWNSRSFPATMHLRLAERGLVSRAYKHMIRLRHTDELVGLLVVVAVMVFVGAMLEAGVLRDWFRARFPIST